MSAAKKRSKSKTLWAAAATVLVGVAEQTANVVPDEYNGIALAGVGLLMAVLRKVTVAPLK